MPDPAAALALTEHLPERHLQAGEVLFAEHDLDHAAIAMLVEGRLTLALDGLRLPDVTVPGSFLGEVGSLLGVARVADVVAAQPSTVRIIGNPQAFFETHPSLALELARQLAGRLHRLLAYVSDVREQFADDSGHLAMVDSVLARLASRPAVEIDGGSDRAPDY
ncbi:MAG: cyclic nucleotide-binding domain-containing protein [Ilumatobacteraceae bacterium]